VERIAIDEFRILLCSFGSLTLLGNEQSVLFGSGKGACLEPGSVNVSFWVLAAVESNWLLEESSLWLRMSVVLR